MLYLYKRAQNGGLNAQEVFWLEGQAAAHPCFAMAYTILARHHYRNHSTIKNRALLKAAAYANNRTLLRHYLEDTLTPPKQKPIPVSEMKPILDKKDAADTAKSVDLAKQKPADAPLPENVAATVVAPETPAAEVIETVTPVAEVVPEVAEIAPEVEAVTIVESPAVESETPAVAESPAENEVAEVIATAEPAAESPVEASALIQETPENASAATALTETSEPENVILANAEPVSETVEEAAIEANEAPAVPETPEVPFVGKAGDINWFLNMRIRLRSDKHKETTKRLQTSIGKFAASAATAPDARSPEEPAIQQPATVLEITLAPENQPAVVEPSIAAETPAVVVETTLAPELVAENTPPKAELEAATAPIVAEPSLQHSTVKGEDSSAAKAKKEKPVPEKQYEIGAFSSFTFLSESETEEAEEVEDIGIGSVESVEFTRSDDASGNGEIIFEENDRIVEISVSPQALDKYFKGRLPYSAPIPAFGEFQIELDEHEYHAAEAELQTPVESAVEAAEVEIQQPALESGDAPEREMMSFGILEREEETPPALQKEKIEAIIDRFIENEPGITRAKSVGIPTGDLAKSSNQVQEDGWVTETLAKIYEKQGNKSKAIKIYEQLRLRLPEKNDYFVSLIEKLKH